MSGVKARPDGESGSSQLLDAPAAWKQMSAEEREDYEVEVMRLKAAYAEQLSDYRELGYYKAADII